jgi:hypothetical protein
MAMSDPETAPQTYRFTSFEQRVGEPSIVMEVVLFIHEHWAIAAGIATAIFLLCAFMFGYGAGGAVDTAIR